MKDARLVCKLRYAGEIRFGCSGELSESELRASRIIYSVQKGWCDGLHCFVVGCMSHPADSILEWCGAISIDIRKFRKICCLVRGGGVLQENGRQMCLILLGSEKVRRERWVVGEWKIGSRLALPLVCIIVIVMREVWWKRGRVEMDFDFGDLALCSEMSKGANNTCTRRRIQ